MAAKMSAVIGSYKLRLAPISEVRLDRLHALSVMIGWPHRPHDWRLLRDCGQGIAALDGIGRVLATAMWFPFGPRLATIGMVITSPRLQARGGARFMMEHALEQMRGRFLRLNATRAARRLYLSLGFAPGHFVYQRQGLVVRPAARPAPDAILRPFVATDLPDVTALDRRAHGADRTALLAQLQQVSTGQVLLRGGRIRAFALCRRFGSGHVIGPAIAANEDDAIAVVRPHLAEHAGKFVRVDTRHEEGQFAAFLAQCGLSVHDTVTHMSLRQSANDAKRPPGSTVFALASHSFG